MRDFILQRVNKLIAKALKTDDRSLQLINKWTGSKLGAQISDWDLKVEIEFLENKLNCTFADAAWQPDVIMRANLAAYLNMAKNKGASASAFKHKLFITGDANFAADCQQLMQNLDIDWEAVLAEYVGDEPAYRAGQVFAKLKDAYKFARKKIKPQIQDYLRDEIKVTAGVQVEDFALEVDECRDHCARLEARVAALEVK